jgi:hypothetical protein
MSGDIFGLRARLAVWVAQASPDELDNQAVRAERENVRTAAKPKKRTHRLLFALLAVGGIFLLFATFGASHAPTATTAPSGSYSGGVYLGNAAMAACQHNSGLAPNMVQEIGLKAADVAAKYRNSTLCDDKYFAYGSADNPPTCDQAFIFIGIMGWQKDLVNPAAAPRTVCTSSTLIGQLAQYRQHLQQIDQQGTPNNNTINIDLNPVDWVKSALAGIGQSIVQWFQQQGQATLDEVASLGFMYSTPPPISYNNGVVQTGFQWSLFALDAAVGLMLVISGYNIIMRRHLDVPASELLHVAPRLVLALVAAHAALLFIGPIIDLMNTLTGDFVNTLGGGKILQQNPGNIDQGIMSVIFAILDLIIMLLLVLEMLVRIALLDLLIILAPFWLAATALPQAASFAQLGASAFVMTLLVQFFQVGAVAMGAAMIATIGVNNPIVGGLVGLAAFYLAFKIPGMLSHLLRNSVGALHRDILFAASFLSGQAAAAAVGAPPAPVP